MTNRMFDLDEFYEVESVVALVRVRDTPGTSGRVFDLTWTILAASSEPRTSGLLVVTSEGESGPHVDQYLKSSHSQWPFGRLALALDIALNKIADTDTRDAFDTCPDYIPDYSDMSPEGNL